MEKMKDITTITGRDMIGLWLNEHGLTGDGAEIGVQNGENAEMILRHWKGRLHLVDPWEKQDPSLYRDGTNDIDFVEARRQTDARMRPFKERVIIRAVASDRAFEIESVMAYRFDFIYLDGNHSSPQVDRDLENWWTLLKPGGLMGSHDYLNLDAPMWRCDVKDAVDGFAAKHGLTIHVTYDQSTPEKGGWPSVWFLKPG